MDTDILFKQSIEDKENFWKEQAQEINGLNFPKILQRRNDYLNGFPTESSICAIYVLINILKMVLEIRLLLFTILRLPTKRKPTPSIRQRRNFKTGGRINFFRIKKGDTAVIYMPMIPQTLFAMLACARIG
jgi:propionyl-CoA synthetase